MSFVLRQLVMARVHEVESDVQAALFLINEAEQSRLLHGPMVTLVLQRAFEALVHQAVCAILVFCNNVPTLRASCARTIVRNRQQRYQKRKGAVLSLTWQNI